MTCHQPHPDHPGVLCDKDTPCYGYHANAPAGLVWPGEPLPQRTAAPTGKPTRGELLLAAQRIRTNRSRQRGN